MQGKYIFYVNNEKICESDNIITTDGMHIIRTYLAGGVSEWAGAISVGAMNASTPTVSDRALEFEAIRVPVLLKSVSSNEIVISATLPSEFSGKIYEMGVYPSLINVSSEGFDDKLLVNFDEDWVDSSDAAITSFSTTSRIGSRSLDTSNTAFYAESSISADISGYSSLDEISILYYVADTGSPRTVTVTFEDGQLPTPGYKSAIINLPGTSAGWNIYTTPLGNFVDYGAFDNTTSKIIIEGSADAGFATVLIDAIRINDADETDPFFALVSRSLIGTAGSATTDDYVLKNAGVEVDIEYRMQIT